MATILHMITEIAHGQPPENNNNPIIMIVLFIVFAINMSISIASVTDIIRLCAAIGALIPAIGGTYIWLKSNKHKF